MKKASPIRTDEQESPRKIQNYVFGGILIVLFLIVGRLFAPFFTVFLWSALLYILISPLHEKITRNLHWSRHTHRILRSIIAGAFAIATTVLILIPLLFVATQFVKQIMELFGYVTDTIRNRPKFLTEILQKFCSLVNDLSAGQITITPLDIQNRLLSSLNMGLQNIIRFSSGVALNIGSFLMSLVFLVFCLFFFYLDGHFLARLIKNIIPIRREYIAKLSAKFKDIAKNLLLGYIMVAVVQSVLAYIVFTIFKIQGALVFAALTFICVFIPMIGGAIVWMPLGIIRILGGDVTGGILFLVISGVCISLLDNILRPMFLQDRINLHPLVIFFAILGGLRAFGFNGIILGPMVVILFLTVLDMFLTEHQIEHYEAQTAESVASSARATRSSS